MKHNIIIKQTAGRRKHQDDRFEHITLDDNQKTDFIIIADGAGGHSGSNIAADIAVETFTEAATKGKFDNISTRREMLKNYLRKANKRIAEKIKSLPNVEILGTTVIACLISKDAIQWVSVGDSHLFLIREGKLHKLNEDHSMAGQMVRSGKFKPDDANLKNYRNILVSALTGEKLTLIDLPQKAMKISPQDIFIIATDGIDTITIEKINDIVQSAQENGAEDIVNKLFDAIEKEDKKNQDNLTISVISPNLNVSLNQKIKSYLGAFRHKIEQNSIGKYTPSSIPLPSILIGAILLGILSIAVIYLYTPGKSIEQSPRQGIRFPERDRPTFDDFRQFRRPF